MLTSHSDVPDLVGSRPRHINFGDNFGGYLVNFLLLLSDAILLFNTRRTRNERLEDTHPRAPILRFWVYHDLVGKWICFGDGNWGDVIFVAVHKVNNLHGGLLKAQFHGMSDFDAICSPI
jgi:hypothetical protein